MHSSLKWFSGFVSRRLVNILLLMGVVLPLSGFSATDKPNIVLIMIDDLGYTDIGAYGSDIDTQY